MATPNYDALRDEYVVWKAMTHGERVAGKLPTTQKSWAKRYRVTDRWCRQVQNEPDFDVRVEAARKNLGEVAERRRVEVEAELAREERAKTVDIEVQYEELRGKLYRAALNGDQRSVELWFKLYGRPFVDAEQASLTSQFADLDDEELLRAALRLVDSDVRGRVLGEFLVDA